MTIRESTLERYLKRRVKDAGGETRKVKWINHNGAPDRFVLLPMCAEFVELKRPGEPLEPHQLREHHRLRWSLVPVRKIDTHEDVDKFIFEKTGKR